MEQSFPRSLDELNAIVAFTEAFFEVEGIAPGLRNGVDLCIEELFVNMVTYNTETSLPISLELAKTERGVRITLTDHDVDRFDPHAVPPVDVEAPVEERVPGGLGLYLVMKMASAIHYEYRDRTSKITLSLDGTTDNV